MKRFITIILILLIVTGIILGGAWLFSRNTAQKNGTPMPSLRQFLSGDATPLQPSTTDGNLSSVFVDDNLNSTTGSTSTPTIGTQVAQFTNTTSTPNTAADTVPGSGAPTGGNGTTPGSGAPTGITTTTTVAVDPTTQTPVGVPPIIPGPECSDADLNIEFTPQELIRLQALQNRFYALSQTLRTDADVATETGNHDNFKAKVDNATLLYNKCTSRTAQIPATSPYKIRIPTPFWHVLAQDAEVFLGGPGSFDGALNIGNPDSSGNYLTPGNTPFAVRTLERSLRLNLW